MFALVFNEIVKLKRSLATLVCLAAPLCAAAFPVMVLLNHPGPRPWTAVLGEGAAVWAFFLYPMAVTALTVLVAQSEHGPGMWKHLLTLPVPRQRLFAAKIAIVALLVLLMTVILYGLLYGAALITAALIPGVRLTGDPQIGETFVSLLLLNGAGSTMIIVQLWTALRFHSFAPPLVLGIVGTFLALALQAARQPVFLPWLAPAYSFSISRPESLAVVLFGYLGGVILAPLMTWRLSRYEGWR